MRNGAVVTRGGWSGFFTLFGKTLKIVDRATSTAGEKAESRYIAGQLPCRFALSK